jgi:hypothetical protein
MQMETGLLSFMLARCVEISASINSFTNYLLSDVAFDILAGVSGV